MKRRDFVKKSSAALVVATLPVPAERWLPPVCAPTPEAVEPTSYLVLMPWSSNKEGVFLDRSDWVHCSEIRNALDRSSTWADFRDADEYRFEDMRMWIDNGGDYAFRENGEIRFASPDNLDRTLEELEDEERIIDAESPFDQFLIPGVMDSMYPDWYGRMEDVWLPDDFWAEFGERSTCWSLRESWWEFSVDRFEEMQEVLRPHGIEVELVQRAWDE